MLYKYCKNENYEDFSSGRVIMGAKGCTNFPVRLAVEIFSRCLNYLENREGISVYDPCCGGGYLLTVIGFLCGDMIREIIGCDYDFAALKTAERNLRLLTAEGMEERINELNKFYSLYGKSVHNQAIKSAEKLNKLAEKNSSVPVITVFKNDITDTGALNNKPFKADIVFTDVPYGNLTQWQGEGTGTRNILESILPIIKPDSVIAICSDKKHKIMLDNYLCLEKQYIGKRKFEILRLAPIK